jgi:tRNA A37 threonylcarbamoyltransferase TsaD
MGQPIDFPFMTLLISGGHTQLLLCRNVGDYTMLGESLDDAVGEVYDKVARCLGVPFGLHLAIRTFELSELQGKATLHQGK